MTNKRLLLGNWGRVSLFALSAAFAGCGSEAPLSETLGTQSALSTPGATGIPSSSPGSDPLPDTIVPFVVTTNEGSGNLSVFSMDMDTGALTLAGSTPVSATAAPSSIAFGPRGENAYVANGGDGTLSAYKIDASTGTVAELPGSPYTTGNTPWAVALDPAGKFVFVGNYASNSINVFVRDPVTGELSGQVPGSPFTGATGPGYSGISIDPSGKFLYVSENEDEYIAAYNIAADGVLTPMSTAHYFTGLSPIPTVMDPFGKFLFATGWATGGVRSYAIAADGSLASPITTASMGANPFAAGIDPKGNFLYVTNNTSGNISAYSINRSTGELVANVPGAPFAAGANPRSITVEPNGKFVYVANRGGDTVSAYSMDPDTGALSPLPVPTYTTGTNPASVRVVRVHVAH